MADNAIINIINLTFFILKISLMSAPFAGRNDDGGKSGDMGNIEKFNFTADLSMVFTYPLPLRMLRSE